MNNTTDLFEELKSIAEQSGIETALERLIEHFRERRKHHELFEVLKMKTRHGLGLPLLYGESPDELDEEGRRKLEDGLLNACREVNPEFMNYNVELADGRVLSGMITAETTNSFTLRRAEDAKDVVLRIDVQQMKSTGQSLMPEGLTRLMTTAELQHLLAFLMQK